MSLRLPPHLLGSKGKIFSLFWVTWQQPKWCLHSRFCATSWGGAKPSRMEQTGAQAGCPVVYGSPQTYASHFGSIYSRRKKKDGEAWERGDKIWWILVPPRSTSLSLLTNNTLLPLTSTSWGLLIHCDAHHTTAHLREQPRTVWQQPGFHAAIKGLALLDCHFSAVQGPSRIGAIMTFISMHNFIMIKYIPS